MSPPSSPFERPKNMFSYIGMSPTYYLGTMCKHHLQMCHLWIVEPTLGIRVLGFKP
jgi:hypothetical protein